MTDDTLHTPGRLARLLVHMGYDRGQILATMRERFPGRDVDSIVEAAYQHRDAVNAELDRMTDDDRAKAAAALAAEMDLTKSIHNRR